MRNMQIQSLIANDQPMLWQMLMYAAHETSLTMVQTSPSLARYGSDWGRKGDLGYAGFVNGRCIGAAWLRLWPEDDHGFGYVADDIPELAFAVVPQFRGRGYGTVLLKTLLAMAEDHYPAVSLNVRSDNAAVHLYKRLGFEVVPGSETVNRIGGTSFNMVYRFQQQAPHAALDQIAPSWGYGVGTLERLSTHLDRRYSTFLSLIQGVA
jgi:ribosomal protein S18 acetylase RimI-like enzyme